MSNETSSVTPPPSAPRPELWAAATRIAELAMKAEWVDGHFQAAACDDPDMLMTGIAGQSFAAVYADRGGSDGCGPRYDWSLFCYPEFPRPDDEVGLKLSAGVVTTAEFVCRGRWEEADWRLRWRDAHYTPFEAEYRAREAELRDTYPQGDEYIAVASAYQRPNMGDDDLRDWFAEFAAAFLAAIPAAYVDARITSFVRRWVRSRVTHEFFGFPELLVTPLEPEAAAERLTDLAMPGVMADLSDPLSRWLLLLFVELEGTGWVTTYTPETWAAVPAVLPDGLRPTGGDWSRPLAVITRVAAASAALLRRCALERLVSDDPAQPATPAARTVASLRPQRSTGDEWPAPSERERCMLDVLAEWRAANQDGAAKRWLPDAAAAASRRLGGEPVTVADLRRVDDKFRKRHLRAGFRLVG